MLPLVLLLPLLLPPLLLPLVRLCHTLFVCCVRSAVPVGLPGCSEPLRSEPLSFEPCLLPASAVLSGTLPHVPTLEPLQSTSPAVACLFPLSSSTQVHELEEVVHERNAMAVRLSMMEARLDETRAERGQVRVASASRGLGSGT